MAGDQTTSNTKKREASYYREYRRKKKTKSGTVIPFPKSELHSLERKFPKLQFFSLKIFLFLLFAGWMTGLLIHLSAPFYLKTNSTLMAYTLAGSVELSVVFLIALKVDGFFEQMVKGVLLVGLSLYALMPIALNPIFNATKNISVEQTKTAVINLKVESLKSEIKSIHEEIEILKVRGRITAAQKMLQLVAQREVELRNTISVVQPIATSKIELQSAYVIAVQRLLLMLCNLFFVHQLAHLWRSKQKLTHQTWRSKVALGCAT